MPQKRVPEGNPNGGQFAPNPVSPLPPLNFPRGAGQSAEGAVDVADAPPDYMLMPAIQRIRSIPPETRAARMVEAGRATAEQLDSLADTNNRELLDAIVSCKTTTGATLDKIASRYDVDSGEELLKKIAAHPHTSHDTLGRLGRMPSLDIQSWVAWHPNAPADLLAGYRDHPSVSTRQGVAENPNTPSKTLFYMANALYEDDAYVRTAAKGNDNYPSADEREAVARNANTPALEREMLAWDTTPKVRKAAKESFSGERPTADDLESEARSRGFKPAVCKRIRKQKLKLEDKTDGVTDTF